MQQLSQDITVIIDLGRKYVGYWVLQISGKAKSRPQEVEQCAPEIVPIPKGKDRLPTMLFKGLCSVKLHAL